MRMPNFPYFRQPNTYNDLTKNKNVMELSVGNPLKKRKVYVFSGTSDGAVVLSSCIKVTGKY
jgi:hypothetical protein